MGKLDKIYTAANVLSTLYGIYNTHVSRKHNETLEEKNKKIKELEDKVKELEKENKDKNGKQKESTTDQHHNAPISPSEGSGR